MIPNPSPTRLGPTRSCTHDATFRSSRIRYATVPSTATCTTRVIQTQGGMCVSIQSMRSPACRRRLLLPLDPVEELLKTRFHLGEVLVVGGADEQEAALTAEEGHLLNLKVPPLGRAGDGNAARRSPGHFGAGVLDDLEPRVPLHEPVGRAGGE